MNTDDYIAQCLNVLSVNFCRFLRTQRKKPQLLIRYTDDIFMLWPHTPLELEAFLTDLNNFNPALHYTFQFSTNTANFLDLIVYKGPYFNCTNVLDTKTYQKPQNLYQYIHFTSNHQKTFFKALITGELIRYTRTNISEEKFLARKELFKQILRTRGYPQEFIEKTAALVTYKDRQRYLLASKKNRTQVIPTDVCVPTTLTVSIPKTNYLVQLWATAIYPVYYQDL